MSTLPTTPIKKPRKPWRKPGTDVTWSLRKVDALRRRCEARGIEFDVSAAHLRDLLEKQNRRCAITGRLLNYTTIATPDSGSIARLDQSLGFVDGNLMWVTQQANEAMGGGSIWGLLEFCKDALRQKLGPGECYKDLCGMNSARGV